jgi:hypothetical protein
MNGPEDGQTHRKYALNVVARIGLLSVVYYHAAAIITKRRPNNEKCDYLR